MLVTVVSNTKFRTLHYADVSLSPYVSNGVQEGWPPKANSFYSFAKICNVVSSIFYAYNRTRYKRTNRCSSSGIILIRIPKLLQLVGT
jgi:hypothetical protein